MAGVMGQVTVPVSGSGSVQVCVVPPGAEVSLVIAQSGAQVWLGMASTVTAVNGIGFTFQDDPMRFAIPRSASAVTLWALNNSALTPVTLGYILTTSA